MRKYGKLFEKMIGKRIISVNHIEKESSNDVCIINDRYVYRYKKKFDYQPFYNSRTEGLVLSKIKPLHIDIYNEAFDKKTGSRISIYEPLAIEFNYSKSTKKQIKEIALTLQKLHNSQIVIKTYFNPLKRIKYFRKESSGKIPPFKADKIISDFNEWYKDERTTFCLCHNDLVGGNIIFIEDSNRIIDYEYASMNDPHFDLASFISENNIYDIEIIDYFLNSYFDNDVPNYIYRKLTCYIRFLNLLWYYWAIEMYRSTKKEFYINIANDKFNHLQEEYDLEEQKEKKE